MQVEKLPIDEYLPELIENLSSRGALVLTAEPGAGKTTRVAPAILAAGLACTAGEKEGKIILLQPRRVAARAAAYRIAEERESKVGEEIGYQVRFEKRSSEKTRILVCTEGIFLQHLQEDPFIEDVAVVIFDEFHERSVDSDLALAMVAQLRETVRPDLKIVVMSATLSSLPLSAYLGNCPCISCPGRTYPVKTDYLQHPARQPVEQILADGVRQLVSSSDGHILAFLPGVGEIRRSSELLSDFCRQNELLLLSLYGDMDLDEQQRVLQPSTQRKIILATNVAETSLTIDGVKAVIDSGLARVNRVDRQLGLNKLELTRISKASATQRAGRAGRTGAGSCLRLWTEKEHLYLREFEQAEIARVDISQCLLQLMSWGEQNVMSFPWVEAPPTEAISDALDLLHKLSALDDGRITELGKSMAKLPLHPRLARLLLSGADEGEAHRAALAAMLLSEKDPFRHTSLHEEAIHKSDSDLIDRVNAIDDFQKSGQRDFYMGQLAAGAARQIIRGAEQLERLLKGSVRRGQDSKNFGDGKRASSLSDEALLRAIFQAFPDRLCIRRGTKERRGLMLGGRGVRLAECSALSESELFVALELIESGRADSLVRLASHVEKDWLAGSHLSESVEVSFEQEKGRLLAYKRWRYFDLILEEKPVPLPQDLDASTALATALSKHPDLSSLADDLAVSYLARMQFLREWMPELEIPDLGPDPFKTLLPEWCCGCNSIADLKENSPLHAIKMRLNQRQLNAIESEAPERITLAGGRSFKIVYEAGKVPILAARIQDFFGQAETPRLASGRAQLILHLQAPNYRVQQITNDLAGFWKNTYNDVRKELKGRYPKHSWPDNPLVLEKKKT